MVEACVDEFSRHGAFDRSIWSEVAHFISQRLGRKRKI
jgi:hypothetical protein